VVRVPTDVTAAQRARWLVELSDALRDAQELLCRLGRADLHEVDALELSARVEAAIAEARSLQLGRIKDEQRRVHPEWSNLPWNARVDDCGP
jgi:hypothetical protein